MLGHYLSGSGKNMKTGKRRYGHTRTFSGLFDGVHILWRLNYGLNCD